MDKEVYAEYMKALINSIDENIPKRSSINKSRIKNQYCDIEKLKAKEAKAEVMTVTIKNYKFPNGLSTKFHSTTDQIF